MIKIKRINSSQNNSLKHFLLNVFNEIPKTNNFFASFIHSLLPNETKFCCEKYAAIEEKNILCEVSITPQSRKNARWHINHLAVGECSDDVISRMIKYVMNKYGGDGVETFITFIDDSTPELKELFQQGCSFRECAHLELWQQSKKSIVNTDFDPSIFSDYNPKYLEQIAKLHNEMIFPQFRQALKMDKDDFRKRFKGSVFKKILLDSSTGSVEGYFLIFKKNGHYYLELLMSDAFATYYPEVLKACKEYIGNTIVLLKKYHTSCKHLVDVLSENEYQQKESYAILVKDYWSHIKNPQESMLGIRVNMSSPA